MEILIIPATIWALIGGGIFANDFLNPKNARRVKDLAESINQMSGPERPYVLPLSILITLIWTILEGPIPLIKKLFK